MSIISFSPKKVIFSIITWVSSKHLNCYTFVSRESPQGHCQDRSNCLFVKNEYELSLLYSPSWIMLLQTPSSIEWLFLWFWFLLFLISFSLNLSHFSISHNNFSKIVSYPAKITGWSSYVIMNTTEAWTAGCELGTKKLQNSKYLCVAQPDHFPAILHGSTPWSSFNPSVRISFDYAKNLQNSELLLSSSLFFSFCNL